MILNQWYGILDSRELKKGKPIGVTRLSKKMVLWRNDEGSISCIADRCCHRGASLSHGKIVQGEAECPFHGFRYDSSGKVTVIPANGISEEVPDRYRVESYMAKEAYGFIWLWNGEKSESVPEIPFFEELKQGFNYSGFSETWNVHYSRAVENQLDVVHLPFVHSSTIGRGNRTLVNGPVVRWEGNLMTFYVKNAVDDGRAKAQKPDEIKEYEKLFSLQFQMPNLWQNRISDRMRIVAMFAPIDDENTHIYIRTYQKLTRIPVLRSLVAAVNNASNRVILHQDRRVVLTQIPKCSELRMDEKLIPGDLPIIEYRKRREALKNPGGRA